MSFSSLLGENVRWEMTQMFQDVFSVSSCPSSPPLQLHIRWLCLIAALTGEYTQVFRKRSPPPCYPQIIPNLKYIPQSCSKEWFLHLFDYHWECHDTLVIVQDVQGTIKENRCISIQAFALFPRNLTRGILVLDGQLAEPKSLKMGWGWNEGSVC